MNINDVRAIDSNDKYSDLSFKGCSKSVFYRLMKIMEYKKSDTKKIIREDIINSERIQIKIKEYLTEKLRLESQRVSLGVRPVTVYLDESVIQIASSQSTYSRLTIEIRCPL